MCQSVSQKERKKIYKEKMIRNREKNKTKRRSACRVESRHVCGGIVSKKNKSVEPVTKVCLCTHPRSALPSDAACPHTATLTWKKSIELSMIYLLILMTSPTSFLMLGFTSILIISHLNWQTVKTLGFLVQKFTNRLILSSLLTGKL